jgi:hypothetical protein
MLSWLPSVRIHKIRDGVEMAGAAWATDGVQVTPLTPSSRNSNRSLVDQGREVRCGDRDVLPSSFLPQLLPPDVAEGRWQFQQDVLASPGVAPGESGQNRKRGRTRQGTSTADAALHAVSIAGEGNGWKAQLSLLPSRSRHLPSKSIEEAAMPIVTYAPKHRIARCRTSFFALVRKVFSGFYEVHQAKRVVSNSIIVVMIGSTAVVIC